jgi:hypothetical protein
VKFAHAAARESEQAEFTPPLPVSNTAVFEIGKLFLKTRPRFLELIGSLVVAMPTNYTQYL